jgi:L-fuculose-phosphate aldolase
MLILARNLGPISYMSERHVGELMEFKKRLGIDDPRLHMKDCDLCGNSVFREGYAEYVSQHTAFAPPTAGHSCSGLTPRESSATNGSAAAKGDGLDSLVQTITEQVLAALNK